MTFLRAFHDSGCFGSWLSDKPAFRKLLKSFEIRLDRDFDPPSVFRVDDPTSELEVVAALSQRNRTIRGCFLVRITSVDLESAGISADSTEPGQTGIRTVDERHANLHGAPEQFTNLVQQIVANIWRAENRLHVFGELTILGEVARLSKLPNGIDEHARQHCNEILRNRQQFHDFLTDDAVSIRSQFSGDESVKLEATRDFVTEQVPATDSIASFFGRIFARSDRGR